MALTEKKVKALATNYAIFQRGEAYARLGRVRGIQLENGMDYDEATAVVRGSEEYTVRVELDPADHSFVSATCGCPAFFNYSGACKHIVAVLLTLIHNDFKQAPARSDRTGRMLLQSYQQLDVGQAEQELDAKEAPVVLQPVLEVSGSDLSLRLKAGRTRMYVIKDFSQLYYAMRNKERISYGQQFSWLHTMDSITSADRPLMRLITEHCAALHAGMGSNYYRDKLGPALPVTGAFLDRLADIVMDKGEKLVMRMDNAQEKCYTLIEGNPRLSARLTQRSDGGMQLAMPIVRHINGDTRLYVLKEEFMHCSDSVCKSKLGPFLQILRQSGSSFYIAKNDLTPFFSSVYPSVEPYIEFVGDLDIAQQYLPLPLTCRIELDAPGNDWITANVIFQYGEDKFNPFGNAPPHAIAHNAREELRLKLQLERIFHFKRQGCLVFMGNDDKIYDFLSDGVQELSRLGEVFVSDRLKRYASPPATKVRASVSLDVDLLHVDIDVAGFPIEELNDVLDAYRMRRRFYRLRSGQFLTLEDDALADLAELTETLGLTTADMQQGKLKLPQYRAMYLDSLLRRRDAIAFDRNDTFKALVRTMKNVEDSDYPVPMALKRILRNYQKTGYRWLRTLADSGFHGLLADDMGLGKTIQIIALLIAEKEKANTLKTLIVCPASLVLNWNSEVERFGKGLIAVPPTGAAAARKEQITGEYDLLITSYDQLKRDIALYEGMEFDYQILDEAQVIKNANTLAAKAAKAIHARHRFALTGTPIENRLSELWSIFDFLMPGYLFSYKAFKTRYELPAVKQQDENALKRIQRLAAPFVLRRIKRDVLKELPDKIEAVRQAELTGEQQKMYLAHLLDVRREVAQNVENDTLQANKLQILALLTRLRQICCDPRLYLENYTGESAKLELCMELIDEAARSGHRILLFSQFTSMLDIIRERLVEMKLSSHTLQGSTPKLRRQELVEDFQNGGADVFLISLKAGGLGLNLTSADVVILYDPWWNTAAENQAADRAYRMGQTKNVQVFRLIAKNTIEERILELQQKKRNLADSVITEGNALQSFTEQDWMSLLE